MEIKKDNLRDLTIFCGDGLILSHEYKEDVDYVRLGDLYRGYLMDTGNLSNLYLSTFYIVRKITNIQNANLLKKSVYSWLKYLVYMVLSCDNDKIIIIQNPEAMLSPKLQTVIADFFVAQIESGKKIVLETQSEHLINRIRYCVYKKQITSAQVIIQYIHGDGQIEAVKILQNGKLLNETGDHAFPKGFFDVTLDDIFEINS